MSVKANTFIQKVKSKLCFKPHKICGKVNITLNETTMLEPTKSSELIETIDEFKTTIIASNMDNERELSQINETINISKFPFLICSPERTRTVKHDFTEQTCSPTYIEQSNRSIREDFTEMWVESYGFNSNDFNSINSEFFNASLKSHQIEPVTFSREPIFI
ncbi:unnamed protein product [Brachionus calyciflorus]|uniref:Uncharacterized protein n=1 Tax=Brachionus calyciflorus TaxID=104777 RepID=A0A813M3Q2_9BILA|nr:unnamed protein product [Brachionus calyciflorus]